MKMSVDLSVMLSGTIDVSLGADGVVEFTPLQPQLMAAHPLVRSMTLTTQQQGELGEHLLPRLIHVLFMEAEKVARAKAAEHSELVGVAKTPPEGSDGGQVN